MKIERILGKLSIHFDHKKLKTLLYESDGNLSVISNDNKVLIKFQTKAEVVYNGQYGTPISENGEYVFIGSWEQGLFCYSLETGKLIWKQTPGKVRKIFLIDYFLVVDMADRGIYVRDSKNGELVKNFKMPSISCFFQLSQTELFAGPRNGKYFLLNLATLEIKAEIKAKILNFNNCLSYCVLDIYYEDNQIIIKGWEQYNNGNIKDSKQTYFERKLPIF